MKLKPLSILVILLLGGFLRFYKLDWGQGLFTHPDEYHIISSVAQLSFPNQMHPHFFSYGTVTIYLIYFTQQLIQIFNPQSFIINPFLIGRFYSALFSTFTIFIAYKICQFFMQTRFSYLAAFLVAITPGLIQQAHFATPESALTFFLFGSLLFMIKFLKQNKILFLVLASVFLGFAMGVKVSSIVFLLSLIVAIIIKPYSKSLSLKTLLKFIILFITSIIIVTAAFAFVAPYVFMDFPAFRSNLEYEGGLAIGKFSVFYTRQFINTMPVLFQIEKILPFALGPFLLLFGAFGFFIVMLNLFRPKQTLNDKGIALIIIISFLSLFVPNAFLFAKWARFIAPTFPFFAILAAFFLNKLYSKNKFISKSLTGILLIGTFLWTIAFFSIYINSDIRIVASDWITSHVKVGSSFLVEGGNTVDLPLSENFPKTSLDFYSLESDPLIKDKIIDALYSSDYFLVQSRRVFYNHQRLPTLYPKIAAFYNAIFDGKMGFTQIKEFNSYPKLEIGSLKLEVVDETAEETWSVFDHPVIRVFKKTKQLSKENYAKFLE